MRMISNSVAALVLMAGLTGAAQAQNFTTAAEVGPILEMTRANWVAVREYDGKDLVYFTQLLSWRCGLTEIRYGLNGAPPETLLPMEPCYEDEAQPNAIKLDQGVLPYITQPLQSVQSLDILLKLDDGSETTANYQRKSVLIP
jgi:hypothetical protein